MLILHQTGKDEFMCMNHQKDIYHILVTHNPLLVKDKLIARNSPNFQMPGMRIRVIPKYLMRTIFDMNRKQIVLDTPNNCE